MYPYGDLAGNLAAFCAVLRREHGFRIGPGEIRDAALALEVVELPDQERVRHAWRPILSTSEATARAFDAAFNRFFFPGPPGVPQPGLPASRLEEEQADEGEGVGAARPPRRAPGPDASDDGEAGGDVGTLVSADDTAVPEEQTARVARARSSPVEAEGLARLRLEPVDFEWRAAARALVRRLQFGISRRWRPGPRGRRFDVRRTWRASLQTGGEALAARWLRRMRRSPRVVVLIDGSRSMETADAAALRVAVAIAGVTRRVQAFVFSTGLREITREVRQAAGGRVVEVDLGRDAWGGGTDIGASLRAFLQRHGERHVGRDTLVIIISDGLDIGEPDVLRGSMRELDRRAAGVAWLNPLLGTAGYEPTSRGMAAARPFIRTFADVPDAGALLTLARGLRVR